MSCIVLYVAELVVFTLFKCLSDTNQSNGKASGIIDDTHQGRLHKLEDEQKVLG